MDEDRFTAEEFAAPEREAEDPGYIRYRIQQDAELAAFMQAIEDGQQEMVRFTTVAANVLTALAARAASMQELRDALAAATVFAPDGFLALCHKLDATPSEFYESLAEFRHERMKRERATPIAGISSPP